MGNKRRKTVLTSVVSVTEAAALLNLSEKRVLVFIDEGRIKAKRLKREWAISLPSVLAFKKKPREPGRPAGWRRRIGLTSGGGAG